MRRKLITILITLLLADTATAAAKVTISGELKKWHKVTLTIDGPDSSEQATPNPFQDYFLSVRFTNGNKEYVVPGYFAADGNAAETGATKGNKWRVNFAPDESGVWSYKVSFRTGGGIAINTDPNAGSAGFFDGLTGTFAVADTDKTGRDFRGKGMLRYVGGHYLQFAETHRYFLKGGADSPENFLAYFEFDQTPGRHCYQPHRADFKEGDPTWKNGRGKNIIGALNYLAGKGMNSVYFLTMNVAGDGNDVWPWMSRDERYQFDCSKLDQWEIVFSHMDKLGLMLHVITQETENDQLLDGGELGIQRKLYYRELIARFSHHLGLVWNLGEENTNTDTQRKAFARYIRTLDPYNHPIVVHTFPREYEYEKVYNPLLGYEHFEGPSIQLKNSKAHGITKNCVRKSAQAGRKWVVTIDESGTAGRGADPDDRKKGNNQDAMRKQVLWGNLTAGGAGVEWYFGYKNHDHDLNCENFRSRERMWDYTRYAIEFFQKYLPFEQMSSADSLVSTGWCLAKAGDIYAVYLPKGGTTDINLPVGKYTVKWYNPRLGGELKNGSVAEITGPGRICLGNSPDSIDQDWVVLIKKINGGSAGPL